MHLKSTWGEVGRIRPTTGGHHRETHHRRKMGCAEYIIVSSSWFDASNRNHIIWRYRGKHVPKSRVLEAFLSRRALVSTPLNPPSHPHRAAIPKVPTSVARSSSSIIPENNSFVLVQMPPRSLIDASYPDELQNRTEHVPTPRLAVPERLAPIAEKQL